MYVTIFRVTFVFLLAMCNLSTYLYYFYDFCGAFDAAAY